MGGQVAEPSLGVDTGRDERAGLVHRPEEPTGPERPGGFRHSRRPVDYPEPVTPTIDAHPWIRAQVEDRGYLTPCWIWTGDKLKTGYPRAYATGRGQGRAHRWTHEAFTGPIPSGWEVDHLCRNITCVNPEHLEAVTPKENRTRQAAARQLCPQGHSYDGWKRYVTPKGERRVSRRCLACHRASESRRAARRRKAALCPA